MNKLILLVCLMYGNVYANKNWIKIDSNSGTNFKMYKPSSSFNKSRSHKPNKDKRMKLIDQKLIDSIRHVQSLAKRYK